MNSSTMNKQIIFVDSSVQDYQSLIQGIDPAQIVILNENSSAIDQITNALRDQKDIEAVHIVSHGSEGSLKLGADVLNENNLETFSDRLKQWGNALTANGDILLYGCDVAAGEAGENFVKRLSEITGADVAASTDKTGNAALGGDWELEKTTGNIEASLALSSEAMATYAGVLASPVQFDLTSVFDRDVIINYTGGVTDTTQDGLSTWNETVLTQSFATFKAGANGNGLPDNGFFATNAYHPDVQLGYNNTNNGNNAKVLTTNGTSFTFAVTPNQYSEIHLFATSTNGNAGMQVTFNYSDGTTGTATATVPDWFSEITETSSSYYLIDGMDQSTDTTGTAYTDVNDPALFGFKFNPNPAKTLQSITVSKTSGTTVDNYLGVFGSTGVLATAVQFDLTSVFDRDVMINYTGGLTDTTQSGLDSSGGTLITQSFATFKVGANGNGLPDNGFFATNAYHPDVQLSYNNTNNGNNAKVLTTNSTSFTFAVTPNQYSEIHLFATSTNGDAGMQVTFNYSDSTTGTGTATVPDWFNEITETSSSYYLIDGMDRSSDTAGTAYTDVNDPALFGFMFNPNPAKTLQSITVSKTSGTTANNYLGVFGATGVLETTPPTAATFTPADNATSVAVAANLVVTLSEAVKKGTGNIVIKKVSDSSIVETINVTAANVTVSGSTVTVNPTTDLAPGTDYYVEIASGAIQDLAGNNYAGTTGATAWNFNTAVAADTTAPTAATFTPADNATNIAVAANLVVTLSEAVQKGTGNIVIKKVSDNSVVETINVTSTNVTVTGSTVTVNPTADLAQGTGYYVEIAAGAIKDLAGNNYVGTTGATAWNFTTVADTTPPTAANFTPADNATNIAVAANLVVTLSEAVQKGTGNIVIKKVSDNSVVETINVTAANVTVSGSTVTVNPTADLAPGTDYYVEIASGAIQDLAGNNYVGTTGATAWNFTTAIAADTTPPTATFTPADNATSVAVAANLVVTLSEAVQKGTGNIVIKKVSDNSVVETINVTSTNVTVTGSTVTVNPTADLAQGTGYYVEIASGAIKDIAGNNYVGTTGATAWNFTTAIAADTTPPTATFTPADNATSVAVAANLVVTLSEAVQKGIGNIVIKKVSDNSVVETINVTSTNVTVSGSQLTINPTADLAYNTKYYIEIPNGAIQDLVGNNYAGITGNNTWDFQTALPPSFEDSNISFPGGDYGSTTWADYNGDGKPDLLLTGLGSNVNPISRLYKNTGSDFVEEVSVPGVDSGSVAWADYNVDGKQDFLLTGSSGSAGRISKLYKNIGSGFTEDTSISLPGVDFGSVAWADYNGDGKQDFLLTGYAPFTPNISKLYKNTGSGFTEDTSVSLPGVSGSSVAWADYNGDGKQDFLLTGSSGSGQISKLYKNTGSGFTEDTSISLPGVRNSSVAWADYNGDGKQDFLLTGSSASGQISKLYKNTGSGFTEDTSVSLPGVSYSSVAWADYNGDGKQDFLLTGSSGSGRISKLYKNTGSGFVEDTSISLPGVSESSVAWADYNGDGKQDFLLMGSSASGRISKLYKNNSIFPDITPPKVNIFTPINNAISVGIDEDLVITFSELIKKGTGNIVIKKSSNNSVVQTMSVTANNVTISDSQLIINPTVSLDQKTDYYVEISGGTIQDLTGNSYAGISGNGNWKFQTIDSTAPTAISFTPADNARNLNVSANLVVNFSEPIQKGVGNIIIRKQSDNSLVESIDVSKVTISGSQLTINPTADLAPNTDYYVKILPNAIKDLAGNYYAGISETNAWNFIADTIVPTTTSFTPANNAQNINVAANLVVNFSESIQKGTGNILIRKQSDKSIAETIPVTANNVTISGSELTINPTADLALNTGYYVEIANGVLKDLAGNNYNGISGDSAWTLKTNSVNVIPTISINDVQVNEKGTNATFTIPLSTATNVPVTVYYQTVDDTAKAGDKDYTAIAKTPITFAAGEQTKTINIPIAQDDIWEPDETFKVTLSNPQNALLGKATGVATIKDSGNQPRISFNSFNNSEPEDMPMSFKEGNSGTSNAYVPIYLDRPSSVPVKVKFETYFGPSGVDDLAKPNEDYTPIPLQTITFNPGETKKKIDIAIKGDLIDEKNEFVGVRISAPENASIDGRLERGFEIENDDAPPEISVENITLNEGNADGNNNTFSTQANFRVTLSQPAGVPTSFYYKTEDVSSYGQIGATYQPVQRTLLTFAPGESSKTIKIPVKGDTAFEKDGSFKLILDTFGTNGIIAKDKGTAIATILNDDSKPTISIPDINVQETIGSSSAAIQANVEIKLSSPSIEIVTVNYSFKDGTAIANQDYKQVTAGTVSFASGETTKSISVPIINDGKKEADETFSAILSSPVNATIPKDTGTITISDQIELSIDNDVTVTEGDTGKKDATFTVSLSKALNVPVTVDYTTTGGTASSGIDYMYLQGKLEFAPGETKKTIKVPVNGDTDIENDETFNLVLSKPSNFTLKKATGTATIVDDDKPVASISDTAILDEDNGTATFTVTLSKPYSKELGVGFTTKDGTAKSSDNDYTALDGNDVIFFSPGQTSKTITVSSKPMGSRAQAILTRDEADFVQVNPDTKAEGDETFSVVLVDRNPLVKAVGEGTVVIDDFNDSQSFYPDGVRPKISVDPVLLIPEGAEGTTTSAIFNLKLDRPGTTDIPVSLRYRTQDGTATVADNDYQALPLQTLTFGPGETEKTIRVNITGDSKPELNERFKLILSGPSNVALDNSSAQGVIFDTKPSRAGMTQLAFDLLASSALQDGRNVKLPFFGQFPSDVLDNSLSGLGKSFGDVLVQNPQMTGTELQQKLTAVLPQGFSLDASAFDVKNDTLQFKIQGKESFNSNIASKGFNLFDRIKFNQNGVKSDEPNALAGKTTVNYDISMALAYKPELGWYINTEKTGLSTVIDEKVKDDSLFTDSRSGFIPVNFTAKSTEKKQNQSQAKFEISLRDLDKSGTDADGFGLTVSEIANNLKTKDPSQPLYNSVLSADGTLNLDGEVALKSGLPSLKFNLYSDLPTVNYVNGKLTTEKTPSFFTLNNIKLDLANFISYFGKPIFGNISRILAPIRPILDFLDTDTKIFGEVDLVGEFDANKDGKVTPLDLMKIFALGSAKYIPFIQKYIPFIDAVKEIDGITRLMEDSLKENGNLAIDLKPYEFYSDAQGTQSTDNFYQFADDSGQLMKKIEEYRKAEAQSKSLQKIATQDDMKKQTKVAGEGVNSQVNKNGGSGTKKAELASKLAGAFKSFDLPILTNTESAGKLLAGEDVPLMTYKLPALELEAEVEAAFRVFGVIKGGIRGSLTANLRSIPIGYDTYGIRKWAETGKDSDLLNGFYMSTNANADGTGSNLPELILKATIGAFAGLDVLVAEAGVEGGIEGTAELNLMEPYGSPQDGKLRANDLAKIFTNPTSILNLQGGIRGYFDAYYDTLLTSEKRIRLASFPIYNFRVGAESGTAQDGYITGAWVFFDANFNNIQDEGESNSMTFPDGSFELQVDMDKFDINKNGKLDPTEGKVVLISGQDISTGLTLDTPLSSVHGSKMVTPLTTIVAQLAQEGMDVTEAQTKVKAALGLLADVDLATFNPLEALANNDPKGLALYAAAIQVQNTIVQTAKFIDGVSKVSLAQLADAPIAAIALSLKGGASVDLAKTETIQAIVESSITKAAASDSTINISQLKSVASTAAQIMALGNQIIKDLVASGRPIKDIALEITKLQAVSVGQIAVGLPDLAAGTVTFEQFLAQNSKEAILARMAKVEVNDPTVRPVVETSALKDPIDPLAPTSDDTTPVTDTPTSTTAIASGKPTPIPLVTPTPKTTSTPSETPSATTSETPTTSETTNNISNDDCICDRITYPKFNQPNAVENTIIGGGAIQIGTAQNDELLGSNSGNIFDGKSGDDNLYGGAGNDIFNGNQGNDFITGGKGDDILYGDEGNDIILGEFGNDLMYGGKGNDLLHGREGTDIIYGNKDDDFLDGGKDNDTLYGGKGNDIMLGSQGDDNLFGQDGDDTLCGGVGNDLINGDAGADILGGCAGNDTLYGGADNDTLTGGKGDDLLDGGMANDSLIGGSGNDIFVLKAGQGFDIIADFTLGQDLMGLTGGLSFGQLELTQNTQGTIIKNILTGEQLGVMAGVNANQITSANFMLV
ncbi:MAG: Ig-like domain-containing protein [Microcoleus sp.]